MIGQDGNQFVLVLGLEQHLNRTVWQLGESGIGGCKHRERTIAFECLHKACGLHRRHKRVEAAGLYCRVDNIGTMFHVMVSQRRTRQRHAQRQCDGKFD